MSLKDRLAQDLKDALRARETVRLSAVRMLRAAILEREKSGGEAPTEADLLAVVQKQAKQRRDAIAQFEAAGRDDLARREAEELAVIEQYLPEQLSDEAVADAVRAIIARTGAASMKDMGRVMGEAMKELQGKADGKRVQAAARAQLGA